MSFRVLAGHRRLLQLLARAISRDSLPPSLILSGPDGVGKRLTALSVAKALNCLAPIRGDEGALPVDACDQCPACRRITVGTHPDVLLIEPEDSGTIKVEQVREAIDRVGYRPFEGRRRVVIVDEADAMVDQAQNALLKTLEEPPSSSVFILVTARPDALLPTVRSRCIRLRFGRLTPAEVAAVLMRPEHGYEAREAHAVAALSDGRVGRALDAGGSDLADVRAAAYDTLSHLARGGGGPDATRTLARKREASASAGNERDDLAVHLQALASLVRDLAVLSTRAHEGALVNVDLKPELERLSGSYDRGRAVRAFGAVRRALDALDRNASPKVVLQWLAFQL